MIYLTDRLTPLFSTTLCLPLRLSLKLSFYLFVVDIGNTFTLLQSVGSDSPFLSFIEVNFASAGIPARKFFGKRREEKWSPALSVCG